MSNLITTEPVDLIIFVEPILSPIDVYIEPPIEMIIEVNPTFTTLVLEIGKPQIVVAGQEFDTDYTLIYNTAKL